MNFFFQCLDYDTHLETLNTKPFIFTHRWMEVIKKISSFPPPVNLLPTFFLPHLWEKCRGVLLCLPAGRQGLPDKAATEGRPYKGE
jgi:hypothetical protein